MPVFSTVRHALAGFAAPHAPDARTTTFRPFTGGPAAGFLTLHERMGLSLKPAVWLVFSVVLLTVPLTLRAAELHVRVTNGPAGPSTLYLALFDNAEALAGNQSVAAQKIPMQNGAAQWVFSGLPAGRYAIKSFADENGNARLDTNILGLPVERYGFSNNARGRMGPPTFDAASIQLEADTRITFELR